MVVLFLVFKNSPYCSKVTASIYIPHPLQHLLFVIYFLIMAILSGILQVVMVVFGPGELSGCNRDGLPIWKSLLSVLLLSKFSDLGRRCHPLKKLRSFSNRGNHRGKMTDIKNKNKTHGILKKLKVSQVARGEMGDW